MILRWGHLFNVIIFFFIDKHIKIEYCEEIDFMELNIFLIYWSACSFSLSSNLCRKIINLKDV